MSNPFILPIDNYRRTINPIGDYVDQAAHFIMKMNNCTYDQAAIFVSKKLKDKSLGIVDPKIKFFERKDNGDRHLTEGTLSSYISESVKKKDLIAPSMTTYISADVKESLLVTYIDDNVAGRSKAKKAEFAAKAAGKLETAKIKNLEQTNKKLSNNAISGAHVSKSTPLANKTAHSTLTSNCRSTSGYGNANNEKLLTGNRHYHNPAIVLNNIVSITTHTDYVALSEVIKKYNIYIPTTIDVVECITYSSNMYWKNNVYMLKIIEYIEKLSGIERAAFVYTGDLYHLRKHNEHLVRVFIDKLSTKVTSNPDITDSYKFVKSSIEDHLILAHQICSEEMKGKGKDYDAIKDTQDLLTLASTTKNITDTLNNYGDLIRAIMVTNNMPASVAYFPESIRRAAITSDTDSTIFTVEDWVKWFCGDYKFEQKHMSVAASCIFLASQAITHILAMMSANFGIQKKRLFQVAMKNEFKFDVFIPTNVAKHYFADISCQEGNVFKESESEIKGVHLKSSNSPKFITKKAAELMEGIMESIKKDGKIQIIPILKDIADIERSIFESIKKGELQFFRLGEIKNPDSYVKAAEESPYLYHLLWNKVFSDKYGTFSEPPYQAIRVATILESPTATKKWLAEMEDKELSERMVKWLAGYGKDKLPTLLLPVEAISANGIPKEILEIIDIRKIVYNLCKIFYLVLETLGFYICNDNITRLISDQY